ncbi:hypothetical protein [Cupriavidus basilensis]
MQADFAQHEFERLQRFCLMTFAASVGIWLVFDLLVSVKGGQGFTINSILHLALLSALTAAVPFVRRAQQFQILNFAFVLAFCVGARLVLNGMPDDTRPIWSMLVAASVLFCASTLPLSPRAFFGVIALAWVLLFPMMAPQDLLELKGILVVCYALYHRHHGVHIHHATAREAAELCHGEDLAAAGLCGCADRDSQPPCLHAQRGQPGAARHHGARPLPGDGGHRRLQEGQ